MATFPIDRNQFAIPVLRFGSSQHIAVSTGAAARSSAITSGVQVILFCCDVACYVKLGNSSVTATSSDAYIPANFPIELSLGASDPLSTNISILGTASGTAHFTELV